MYVRCDTASSSTTQLEAKTGLSSNLRNIEWYAWPIFHPLFPLAALFKEWILLASYFHSNRLQKKQFEQWLASPVSPRILELLSEPGFQSCMWIERLSHRTSPTVQIVCFTGMLRVDLHQLKILNFKSMQMYRPSHLDEESRNHGHKGIKKGSYLAHTKFRCSQ